MLCIAGEVTTMVMKIATESRKRLLGPMHPTYNLLKEVKYLVERFLPPDAYLKATGRLFISLTKFVNPIGEHRLISEFANNDELVEVRDKEGKE